MKLWIMYNRKHDGCKNNPESSSTTKLSEHIPSGFSISTISSFRGIGNKHDVCRGLYCMKKNCEFLREHAMKIINFDYHFIIKELAEEFTKQFHSLGENTKKIHNI